MKSWQVVDTGYLLFEDKQGKTALITAETLGDMLNRQKVGWGDQVLSEPY
ncbi:hypothetical protein NIES4073_69540 [Kalymmatonema gypsitolerans NIES-4073]|jgi:hypothetical protein|nr:hypothetical protein NIES4073_69540 [Scytonema sp. NIES-4073]